MKAQLTLAMIFTFGATAFADTLTLAEQNQACAIVRSIVPTEHGPGISQKDCLEKFNFEVLEKTGSITVVDMNGQTVEDMATVCTVYLLSDPYIEIAVPAPSCSLE